MSTAKAITNGYFPFGAAMISDAVAEAFEKDESGSASVGHGYTYSGHPVGAAAALACLDETKRIKPWDNAAARGPELKAGLLALAEKYDVVGDVRGTGLMCALELVADRDSKTPVAKDVPLRIQTAAYEAGAMIRVSGNNMIFSPPLVLTSDDVDGLLAAADAGLSAA